MTEPEDIVLDSLIAASKECAPDLPEALLRRAYEIQVNYQFEKDREISYKATSKLVEEYVNTLIKQEGNV